MPASYPFTEERWARLEADWSAWWAHDLSRPLVMIESLDPRIAATLPVAHRFPSNYPLSMPPAAVLDHYQPHLELTHFYGDAFPRWKPNFGAGIIAGFLGAEVNSTPETVWFTPLPRLQPQLQSDGLAALDLAYDPGNVWWRRVWELEQEAVERWGPDVAVAFTDLGCNLDILASLRGSQQLLLDLYDTPGEVCRLVESITALWLRYYDELHTMMRPRQRGSTPWAPIWSSGRCYMLQCDFAYMISPAMFERFVLPDLQACAARLDHAFYHLDGKGQIRHLDLLLGMERMHGIQWIPGDGAPPAEEWMPVLRRIKDAGKLCQLFVSARERGRSSAVWAAMGLPSS